MGIARREIRALRTVRIGRASLRERVIAGNQNGGRMLVAGVRAVPAAAVRVAMAAVRVLGNQGLLVGERRLADSFALEHRVKQRRVFLSCFCSLNAFRITLAA